MSIALLSLAAHSLAQAPPANGPALDTAAQTERAPVMQSAPGDAAPAPPTVGKLDSYISEIERIETEQGAWGTGLTEQLAGLGENLQLRGRHRDAIDVFDRAIHVNRINNGLYDLSQVPLVESQVESLIARGEWEQVHERNEYLYWVHRRNYGDQDPRMLPVIDKLGTWALNDYALNNHRRSTDQLINAHNLFEHATRIISDNFGDSDLRMVDPLRGLVLSNWFFATYRGGATSQQEKERLSQEIGPEIESHQLSQNVSGNITYFGANGVYYPNDDRSPQLVRHIRNSMAGGREAIRKMVEIYANNPDAPPGAAAGAKIELGDWYMVFHRWQSATDQYQEAYAELAASEETTALLDKYFSRPVALPDMELLEVDDEERDLGESQLDEIADEGAGGEYVLVTFDVTRYGEATNIDILDSSPKDNVGNRVKVKRSLETSRFRPRLVDGEPVTTTGLTQRYVFAGN